jgi:hypothetical protein
MPEILFVGFNDIWISQDVVDEDKFVCEFKQRFIDCFVSEPVAVFCFQNCTPVFKHSIVTFNIH